MSPRQLFEAKTRVPAQTIDNLAELARRNERSIAAEIRLAIEKHLADAGYNRYRRVTS